jgi:hypothetical protein
MDDTTPVNKCRTGCTEPGAHNSYGACLRAASVRVAYCNSANGFDATKQKRWDAELASYRSARAEGIEPAGTSQKKIDQARAISDITGRAFGS